MTDSSNYKQTFQRLHDTRFLRELGRRFCARSRVLDGGVIVLIQRPTHLEIHIQNAIATMVCLGWRDGRAFVIDEHSHPRFLSSAALAGLETALTQFVGAFLHRHHVIWA
jgi:hypothetical protein